MLYTKLLRESLKASCVGVMLWRLQADSSYLRGYMQEHQVAMAYAYYSYLVYFCTIIRQNTNTLFGLLFGPNRIRIEYSVQPYQQCWH